MQGLRSFGKEIGSLIRSKKMLISVIGVLFIPIMYSGMFVGAFWDPYGKLDKLPVAVVNEDKGATLEGKTLAVGDDLVERLKDNDQFRWLFVDAQEAENGLKNGSYYMAIEIPADFSQRATTLMDKEPHPAEIKFVSNQSLNYLAYKIGSSAVEELKSNVSREVTKAYAQAVFEQIGKAAEGLAQASDGAGELHDGAVKAKDGAAQLQQNLQKLAEGTLQLQDGIRRLKSGASDVAKGAAQVRDGSSALADGLGQLHAGAQQLQNGAAQTAGAGKELSDGLSAARQSGAQLAESASQLAAGLAQYAAARPDAAQDAALQQLLRLADGVAAGAQQFAAGQASAADGAAKLLQGQEQLRQGLDAFAAKLDEAAKSGGQLAAGAASLADGAARVSAGIADATEGAANVAAGSGRIEQGSADLASGMDQLVNGTAELSGKLSEASRSSGDVKGTDPLYDMFADPVRVDERKLTDVPNYGTGFAPYFLALGLYVGALLSTNVLPMRDTAEKPRSGWNWFVGKTLLFVTVGILQAAIADAILIYGLGVHVHDTARFVGLSLVTAITFMLIVQFLVTTMGQPGQFVAIVFLLLQLTGSAGTYPRELLPQWLQRVGEWLPMTYAISGLRSAISGGEFVRIREMAEVLGSYAGVSALLTLLFFIAFHRFRGKKNGRHGAAGDHRGSIAFFHWRMAFHA